MNYDQRELAARREDLDNCILVEKRCDLMRLDARNALAKADGDEVAVRTRILNDREEQYRDALRATDLAGRNLLSVVAKIVAQRPDPPK